MSEILQGGEWIARAVAVLLFLAGLACWVNGRTLATRGIDAGYGWIALALVLAWLFVLVIG